MESKITTCRLLWFLTGLFFIGIDAGCGFLTWPAEEEKLNADQAYWFHYEASRRGGFLIMTDDTGSGKKVKMCAEPPPDVALARTTDLIAKVAHQGASGDIQAKLAEQLAQLGGRTQNVLILRESLFRLCELSVNSGLGPDQLKALYEEVIKAAVDLVTREAIEARAKEKQADAELKSAESERIKTFNMLPDQYKQQFVPK